MYQVTNWKPLAKNYRFTIGLIEVINGSLMVLIPGRTKNLANIVLLVIMAGALYTHKSLNDPFDRMIPAILTGILLICRLFLARLDYNREIREELMMNKLYEEVKQTREKELRDELIKQEAKTKSKVNEITSKSKHYESDEKKIK